MLTEPKRLGDPHLGRKFNKGIPVERRGDREKLVREDFVRQLNPEGASVHICMGDLFDKPQVSYDDLQFAYRQYRRAAAIYPYTQFYILQGNHDDSRDLDEVTAWDLFCDNVEGISNINTVTSMTCGPDFILFPWHPTQTAAEMVAEVARFLAVKKDWAPKVAYGHWDVDPRSASHNLIPTKELAAIGITKAHTGHIHLPSTFKRDGIEVEVVGSMQPYAQGEDGGQSDHIRYATFCINGLEDALIDDPQALANTVVRLQLQPGEQWEGQIPACQSFDIQRMRPVETEAPADISMEGFDTTAVARAALDEHDIIPEVRGKIDKKWSEVFGHVDA